VVRRAVEALEAVVYDGGGGSASGGQDERPSPCEEEGHQDDRAECE
jgi:hypothetical protein